MALPTQNDGICEILLEMDARRATSITLTLSNKADETVAMTYDATKNEVSFDRTRSGITDFSQDFPSVTVAPTHTTDGKLNLRIFIDRSSIELFEQNGRLAMTNLVFPTAPYSTLSLQAEGGNARVNKLTIYSLQTIF